MRLIDATRLVKLSLIERDKIPLTVAERYAFGARKPNQHGQSMRGGIRKILRLIEQAPTVDAVPVVRCRDCSNTDPAVCLPDGMFYCNEWESTTRGHWYCCRGEKKEEVEDHDQP